MLAMEHANSLVPNKEDSIAMTVMLICHVISMVGNILLLCGTISRDEVMEDDDGQTSNYLTEPRW